MCDVQDMITSLATLVERGQPLGNTIYAAVLFSQHKDWRNTIIKNTEYLLSISVLSMLHNPDRCLLSRKERTTKSHPLLSILGTQKLPHEPVSNLLWPPKWFYQRILLGQNVSIFNPKGHSIGSIHMWTTVPLPFIINISHSKIWYLWTRMECWHYFWCNSCKLQSCLPIKNRDGEGLPIQLNAEEWWPGIQQHLEGHCFSSPDLESGMFPVVMLSHAKGKELT